MQLLGLIRFVPVGSDHLRAWEACEQFERQLPDHEARAIHREDLQMLVLFADMHLALELLSETLRIGTREGYAISGGLAQGIRSRATVASSLSGFTEGSIETLFEVSSAAASQEIAISAKLSSLVRLSAPDFIARFVTVDSSGIESRIRSPMVMRAEPDVNEGD